jgi:signal transduction histidine kinase
LGWFFFFILKAKKLNDNNLIIFLVAGSVLITLLVFYITIFMVIQKSKTRRFQMEKRELQFRYENELLQTRLEVQEQALNQVSQEIHDNIGQALSVAKVNLNMLGSTLTGETADLVNDSKEIIAKALTDLRNVSHVLNTENISRIGLEEAIKKELEYLKSYSKIQYELSADGDSDNVTNEKELLIFRIAQEALTNIVKHAKATKITILLYYHPGSFEMNICDNGIGFADKDENSKGIGIINMRQRAQLMKGTMQINSPQAGGTTIKLNVPL